MIKISALLFIYELCPFSIFQFSPLENIKFKSWFRIRCIGV